MAEHGSGRFFYYTRAGVIQVSAGRRYAGICGQVSYRYLQAGVTQASAGSRCASVYMQVLRKYLQQGVAQVLQVMSMKLNDIRQEVSI
jgi:hypothetical protein